jgi:hypothetical protein
MGGDLLRLDQSHVIKKQAHDAFALTEVDARVLPDLRQLLGQAQNALASLGAECGGLLLAAALVFLDSFGMTAQFVVPFGLERLRWSAVTLSSGMHGLHSEGDDDSARRRVTSRAGGDRSGLAEGGGARQAASA